MKIIYVAKIDCMYLWCTASDTREECAKKALEVVEPSKKHRSVVSQVSIETIDTFLLL